MVNFFLKPYQSFNMSTKLCIEATAKAAAAVAVAASIVDDG